jgi:hypothetical protein
MAAKVPMIDMESGSIDGDGRFIPTGCASYGVDGLLTQDDSTYVIGPHSLHVENVDITRSTGFQTLPFSVVAGRTYRWRFWAKAYDLGTNNLRILMKDGDGSTTIALTQVSPGTGDWKIVERIYVSSITGDLAVVRIRSNSVLTDWYIDQLTVDELSSDVFFGPDPTERLTTLSDVCKNTRFNVGGNVWFDVVDPSEQSTIWSILNTSYQNISWDILNTVSQDISWDIIKAFALNTAWAIVNSNTQNISWTTFARILYYIQKFLVKSICFDYNIPVPISFDKQLIKPLEFTFYPTGTINDTTYLSGGVFDTIHIKVPIAFNKQIVKPVQFTYNSADTIDDTVHLHGELFDTISIKAPTVFSSQISNPQQFTFKPIGTIEDTMYLHDEVFDTTHIKSPTVFNFQIKEPVQFTFGIAYVMQGEQAEYLR